LGDTMVQRVGGSVRIKHGKGGFQAEKISGDLALAQLVGNITTQVAGNAVLDLPLTRGQQCRVNAAGDIHCRIPAEANVRVELESSGDLAVRNLSQQYDLDHGRAEFVLGSGDALLALRASGNLLLNGQRGGPREAEWGADFERDFGFEFSEEFGERAADFAQQIAIRVEKQVSGVARQLEERLAHWGGGDEIAVRVQEKVQAALRRAEEAITEGIRNAEQRAREAERRAAEFDARRGRRSMRWETPISPTPPRPPRAPRSKTPTVSEEERLMVLRMVSEGKISVEQAEQLLAALGRSEAGD
jgi:ElaB/YqjD/DUF883 family membrane-anchored ribosome-binding protein